MRSLAIEEPTIEVLTLTSEGVPLIDCAMVVTKEDTASTEENPLSGSADLSSTSGGSTSPHRYSSSKHSEDGSTELGRTDTEDVSSASAGSANIVELVENSTTTEEHRRTQDTALPHDPLRRHVQSISSMRALPHDPLRSRVRSISPMRIVAPLRDAEGRPLTRPRGRLESQDSASALELRTSVSPMRARQQVASPTRALVLGFGAHNVAPYQSPSLVRTATCRVVSPVGSKRAPSPVATCGWRQQSASPVRTFPVVPVFPVVAVFGQRSSPLRTRPAVTANFAPPSASTKEYSFPWTVSKVAEVPTDTRGVARDERVSDNADLKAGASELSKRGPRETLAQALPKDISRSRIRSISPMRIVAPLRDEEGKPLHQPRGRLEAAPPATMRRVASCVSPPRSRQSCASPIPTKTWCREPTPPATMRRVASCVSPPRVRQSCASPTRTWCRELTPPSAVQRVASHVSTPRLRCASPTKSVFPYQMTANAPTSPSYSSATAACIISSSPPRQRPQLATVNAIAPRLEASSSRFLLGPTVTPQQQPVSRMTSYCVPAPGPSPFAQDLVPQTWFGF